jgi:hypothetical protein
LIEAVLEWRFWRLTCRCSVEVAADSATFSYRLDRNKLRQIEARMEAHIRRRIYIETLQDVMPSVRSKIVVDERTRSILPFLNLDPQKEEKP